MKLNVYTLVSCGNADDIADQLRAGKDEALATACVTTRDWSDDPDWELIGILTLRAADVEPVSREERVTKTIESLREKQRSVLGEAQAQATRIEQRIQSLLAITNEPSEVQA